MLEKQLQRSYEEGVILAHTFSKKSASTNPAGWWMSEKLDGVRAYYNGENFYTRNGNKLKVPDFFFEGLPRGTECHLDGELYIGRGQFEACVSIVRSYDSRRAEEWRQIRFLVFDAPVVKGKIDLPYEERVAQSEKAVSSAPFATTVAITKCRGETHLEEALAEVLSQGGEGLMLREAGSLYERRRSHSLLKVKSFNDAEARVIGHSPDNKIEGALGSLVCEMPVTGVQFKVGSGIAMSDRIDFGRAKELWPVGTIISYKYQGLTDANGCPRFPTYLRRRDDRSWEEVVADATASSGSEVEDADAVATPPRKRAAVQGKNDVKKTVKKKANKGAASAAGSTDSASGGQLLFSARGLCESESGGKFWEVKVNGGTMTVTYGKVNTKGRSTATEFSNGRAATKEAKKVMKQKVAKGYVF